MKYFWLISDLMAKKMKDGMMLMESACVFVCVSGLLRCHHGYANKHREPKRRASAGNH